MKKRSIAKAATTKLEITECPTCGSKRIKQVRRNWHDTYQGQTYTVPNLTFWECPDCSERLFDRIAMRQIEAHSPAYAKPRRAAG
jgi:YgiT-type zinc finger domain-containing protein